MTTKQKIITYLFICIIILNIYDIVSTYILLNNGGEEMNFIMLYFINLFGVLPGLIIAKLIALGCLTKIFIDYIKNKFNKPMENKLFEIGLCSAFLVYFILFVHQTRMLCYI